MLFCACVPKILCNVYYLCALICVHLMNLCSHLQVYIHRFCLWMWLYSSVFVSVLEFVSMCLNVRCIYKAGVSVYTVCVSLTERSFHVIGRTCLGIPDQLSFRSSSVKQQQKYRRVHIRFTAETFYTKSFDFPLKCDRLINGRMIILANMTLSHISILAK